MISSFLGPTHGKVVVCYLGSWSTYRPGRGAFQIENIDPSLCTHIIYSFSGLDIKQDSIKVLGKKLNNYISNIIIITIINCSCTYN